MSRLFPQPEAYADHHGQTWRLLPDTARWSRPDGAFLVAGTPVMVQGDYYLDETPVDCPSCGTAGCARDWPCRPF